MGPRQEAQIAAGAEVEAPPAPRHRVPGVALPEPRRAGCFTLGAFPASAFAVGAAGRSAVVPGSLVEP
ncbi:hypothetical protein OG612_02325 [Streptomyces sp. NBC_01527]|uniref:hypothetical protein n=1 Tax=unclassified Streptomyces TaxID=2593676 RepID=UPI002E123DA0|nr:hypothetical protein OG763_41350 [Streptomyces sp. NBC_01230]